MFVRHRLVQTPVNRLFFRQLFKPSIVLLRTLSRPRRWSLMISEPSTLINGVTLPSLRICFAFSSVMKWPLVKIWK